MKGSEHRRSALGICAAAAVLSCCIAPGAPISGFHPVARCMKCSNAVDAFAHRGGDR